MHWPDFANLLMDIRGAIGRLEGRLQANTERLDRIEARIDKERRGLKISDFAPYLYGAIILVLAGLGKITVQEAIGLIK